MFLYSSYNVSIFILPSTVGGGIIGLLINFALELIGLSIFQYFTKFPLKYVLLVCCFVVTFLIISADVSLWLYYVISGICGVGGAFLSLIQGCVVIGDESDVEVIKFNVLYSMSFILGPLVCLSCTVDYLKMIVVILGCLACVSSLFVDRITPPPLDKITVDSMLGVVMFLHGYNEGLFYVYVPLQISEVIGILYVGLVYGISLFLVGLLLTWYTPRDSLMLFACLICGSLVGYCYHARLYYGLAIVCGVFDNIILCAIMGRIKEHEYSGYSFLWILGYLIATLVCIGRFSNHFVWISLMVVWFYSIVILLM